MNYVKLSKCASFLENNVYFFDGERVLKPENCMKLDSEMKDKDMI